MNFLCQKDFWNKQILSLFVVISFIIVPLQLFRDAAFEYVPLNAYTGDHQWLTASSVKFLNVWLEQGACKSKFLMYEEPFLIENGNRPNSYFSYPPGTLIPAYVVFKLMGKTHVTPEDVKNFAVGMSYVMICLLAAAAVTIFHLAGMKIFSSTAGAAAISASFAYLAPNFYYLRQVFFSDQMVLFYLPLFLLLEYLDLSCLFDRRRWIVRLLQALVIFCGCFTDHYFFILTAVACLFRIYPVSFKNIKADCLRLLSDCWKYAAGAGAALILFIGQLLLFVPDFYAILYSKFVSRSFSVKEGNTDFALGILWRKILYLHPFALFFIGVGVLFTVYYFFKTRRQKDARESTALVQTFAVLLYGSLLHTTVFFQHSLVHEFSVLKYCFVIVFSLILLLYFSFRSIAGVIDAEKKLFYACLAALVFVFPFTLAERAYQECRNRSQLREATAHAEFIGRHTQKSDVWFSFSYEIIQNPPFALSFSGKRVYKLRDLGDFPMDRVSPDMTICFLLNREELNRPDISEILPYADGRAEENNFVMLRYSTDTLMKRSALLSQIYHIMQKPVLWRDTTRDIEFRFHNGMAALCVYRGIWWNRRPVDFFLHVYKKGTVEPLFVQNFKLDCGQVVHNFTGRSQSISVIPQEILEKGDFIRIGQFIPGQKRLWERDIPLTSRGGTKYPDQEIYCY